MQLHRKSIMLINHSTKVLENFGAEVVDSTEDDIFNKLGKAPALRTIKSFNTSRSSAANLKDLLVSNEHKK